MLKQYGFQTGVCGAAGGSCIWLLSKETKHRLGIVAPEPSAWAPPKPARAAKAIASCPSKNVLPPRKMTLLLFVYHFTPPGMKKLAC